MSELFTGKAISKSVSMPEDMWRYFERRRTDYGIPVSYQIQTILENAIKAASAPARVLVDQGVEYQVEGGK